MARPRKKGMSYFSHDCDAAEDEKMEAMRAEYGNDGYAFWFISLERIYRTDRAEFDASKPAFLSALRSKIGVTKTKFEKMIFTALEIGLFDKKEYEERKVLTSEGIKSRFAEVEAMRERWRKAKDFHEENPEENPAENAEENSGKTPQRKVKESKVKHSYTSDFETFWNLYPRKDDKKPSYAAWQARLKEGFTSEQITLAAKNYLAKCKAAKTEPQFIKMAKTFLGPGGHIAENLEQTPPNIGETVTEWTGPACSADFAAEIARRAQ